MNYSNNPNWVFKMINYYDNFYLTVTLLIDVHVFCVVFIFSFIVLVFITITNDVFMNNYHFRLRHMSFISFSF